MHYVSELSALTSSYTFLMNEGLDQCKQSKTVWYVKIHSYTLIYNFLSKYNWFSFTHCSGLDVCFDNFGCLLALCLHACVLIFVTFTTVLVSLSCSPLYHAFSFCNSLLFNFSSGSTWKQQVGSRWAAAMLKGQRQWSSQQSLPRDITLSSLSLWMFLCIEVSWNRLHGR